MFTTILYTCYKYFKKSTVCFYEGGEPKSRHVIWCYLVISYSTKYKHTDFWQIDGKFYNLFELWTTSDGEIAIKIGFNLMKKGIT